MRYLLGILLVICMVGVAAASELGNQMPTKSDSHIYNDPNAPEDRQGGETVADATVMPGLPYNDTGSTVGYIDDYDETCPYTGSTSADVTYSWVSTITGGMSVDLLGSDYDTKLYVYDGAMNLVGCNDDFHPGYVSFIDEVIITAGETYYIIVDGYGGSNGNYVLTVLEIEVLPPMECPAGAQLEGEPPLMDEYVDNYNGGCNSTPPCFSYIDCLDFCGVGGWYLYGGSNYRDTDWHEVTAAGSTITWTVDAESEVLLYQLDASNCPDVVLVDGPWNAGPNSPTVITLNTTPGQIVCLFTASTVFANPGGFPDGMFEYIYALDGIVGTSATEIQTWSGVKSLYR